MKKPLELSRPLLLPLFLAYTGLLAVSLCVPRTIAISPPQPAYKTVLRGSAKGHDWSYTAPYQVNNVNTIEKLIQCESQGVNIARPDSNGLISWGILQFNGTSTWAEMERRFNFYGSPLMPSDAIKMADMMISAGYLHRWTCARILHLLP